MKLTVLALAVTAALAVAACESGDDSGGTTGGVSGGGHVRPDESPSALFINIRLGHCLDDDTLAVKVSNGGGPSTYVVEALQFDTRHLVKRWKSVSSNAGGEFTVSCTPLKKGHHVLLVRDVVTGRTGELAFDVLK